MKKKKSKKYRRRRFKKFIFKTFICIALLIIVKNKISHIDFFNSHEKAQLTSDVVAPVDDWLNNAEAENEKANKYELTLVNRDDMLSHDFIPKDLTLFSTNYSNVSGELYISKTAKKSFEKLLEAAYLDNVEFNIISIYRDYYKQQELYDNEVINSGEDYAKVYVAKAGASEHQLGLSIDLTSTDTYSLDESFKDTENYRWLEDNMSKYGFIFRYPKDKTNVTGYEFEPWHIRYVGQTAAKVINSKKITLEEYLNLD